MTSWSERKGVCSRPSCGHEEERHEHYRAGMDCSQCGCREFVGRATWVWWRLYKRSRV